MATYNAVVGVVLHFESYRNIDLPHQGLYFLRATLSSEDHTATAIPLDIHTSSLVPKAKQGKINYYNVIPASIQGKAFNTKIFTIRYCEEEVELNDICEFRLEIPTKRNDLKKSLEINYVLSIELHFGTLINIGGTDKLPIYLNNIKETISFEMISTQKYIIRDISKSISQYISVQTDKNCYGIANATLHSTLLDFRYRAIPLEPFFTKPTSHTPSADEGKTLSDYLFGKSDGSILTEVQSNEADNIYSEYVSQLVSSYNFIKKRFANIKDRCLDEKERGDNSELLKFQELVLPGEELNDVKEDLTADLLEETKQGSNKDECDIDCESNHSQDHFKVMESMKDRYEEVKLKCSLKIVTKDTFKCTAKFALNISLVSGQIIEIWQRYIELLTITPRFITEMLKLEYIDCITKEK